jgi:hypothetical protein
LGYCLSEKELSNKELISDRKISKVKEHFDTKSDGKFFGTLFYETCARRDNIIIFYDHFVCCMQVTRKSGTHLCIFIPHYTQITLKIGNADLLEHKIP